MSFSLRYLPTLLLALVTLPISLFAQSTGQTSKVPRGVISGRIMVPSEPDKSEDVLRFFIAEIAADGTFALNNLPPRKVLVFGPNH